MQKKLLQNESYSFVIHVKLKVNTLGNIAGINPSTIYNMLNSKSQNPGLVSIKKICDGLDN